MPYTRILIHYIWATKSRKPFITPEMKPLLLSHIESNSLKKEIHIICLNCVSDHIHLLISLGREQTVATVAMLIKGESAFWVNKQKILRDKFEWQEDYIALSVSISALSKVRKYIAGQEKHHEQKTFLEQYRLFLRMGVA